MSEFQIGERVRVRWAGHWESAHVAKTESRAYGPELIGVVRDDDHRGAIAWVSNNENIMPMKTWEARVRDAEQDAKPAPSGDKLVELLAGLRGDESLTITTRRAPGYQAALRIQVRGIHEGAVAQMSVHVSEASLSRAEESSTGACELEDEIV